MHICGDEIAAMAAALPFLGWAWGWLRNKLRRTRCE